MAKRGSPTDRAKENLKKGKRFSSDYQPEKNGRPKNVFSHLHGLYEVSRADIEALLTELTCLSKIELQSVAHDPNTPAVRAIIAASLLRDAKAGSTYSVDFLFDRLFGKAVQKTEQNISINTGDANVADIMARHGVSQSKN